MTLEQKIDQLIEKFVHSGINAERRSKAVDNNLAQANQLLVQSNKTMVGTAQDIQSITSQTLSSAFKTPTEEFQNNIKGITNKLYAAAHEVNASVEQAHKKLNRIILLALGTFVVAGVVVFGAWFYMYKQLDNKIE